jgi:hypothetical protein
VPERKKYEESDFRPRTIAVFFASLAILAVVTLLLMAWALRAFSGGQAVTQTSAPEAGRLQPGPRLQVSPSEDLKEMRAMEDLQLDSYRWVDPEAGIASIPIDRAMELVVKRGLPVKQPENQRRKQR